MKDTNVPVEECCDGECNHDDCCGKIEANCTHKKSVPVEKWEKEFDELKKGFLSTVNGEWWASDEDFIKDFISRTIATAVSNREKEEKEEKYGCDCGGFKPAIVHVSRCPK